MQQFTALLVTISIAFSSTFANLASAEPRAYYSTKHEALIIDGKHMPKPSGFSGRIDYGDAFASSPEAQKEYLEARRQFAMFPYFNWGAVVLSVGYMVATVDDDNYRGGVALGLFLVPWLIGIRKAGKATRHMQRAINILNGVSPEQAGYFPSTPLEIRLAAAQAAQYNVLSAPGFSPINSGVQLNLIRVSF